MKITFRDHDHDFTLDLARRPKKGTRIEHQGEEYIVDAPRIVDGKEIVEVRGPRRMQAAIDSMTAFAKLQKEDE
jgi:hypothetical protein